MSYKGAFLVLLATGCTARYSCDDCNSLVVQVRDSLLTEKSIESQIKLFNGSICGDFRRLEAKEACREELDLIWFDIASSIWSDFFNPSAEWMCGAPGACNGGSRLTCEECKNDVRGSMDRLASTFIGPIVKAMSGDEGCGIFDEPASCKMIVSWLIPQALPVIAQKYEDIIEVDTICNAVVPYIC